MLTHTLMTVASIFLQHAISACVIEEFGKQARAGIAVQMATNGINVCLPTNNSTVSAHVPVKAAANLTEGIYRFEVWIDGVKQTFVRNGNLINYLITLDAGLHRFEFVAYNLSGTSRVTKTVRATVR
jgi:hypothetical protein